MDLTKFIGWRPSKAFGPVEVWLMVQKRPDCPAQERWWLVATDHPNARACESTSWNMRFHTRAAALAKMAEIALTPESVAEILAGLEKYPLADEDESEEDNTGLDEPAEG